MVQSEPGCVPSDRVEGAAAVDDSRLPCADGESARVDVGEVATCIQLKHLAKRAVAARVHRRFHRRFQHRFGGRAAGAMAAVEEFGGAGQVLGHPPVGAGV
ncbi:hypothetical protein ACIO93_35505 [Streptomyces sp. NPDC087903]|uniref:hypothetical protein n=1 Tax=Streptomyces sp. NPDC087903 TaxID=3365819 RepID=UPI003826EE13